MKNPFIILTILFLLIFGTTQLQAQNFNLEKKNYVVLSKNIQQVKPILLTAKALALEDGEKYGDFYVIICGKTVVDIPNNPDFNVLLKEAKVLNINIFVCGISLAKFNINPDQMPNTLAITENGILYGFQLTKKGFFTLTI